MIRDTLKFVVHNGGVLISQDGTKFRFSKEALESAELFIDMVDKVYETGKNNS